MRGIGVGPMLEEIKAVIGGEHYLAMMLVLVLAFVLTGRSILSERVNQGSFWIPLFACVLLIALDVFESIAQMDPARRDLRMVTSIAGYALRPVAVLGFLLVVWPPERKKWFFWIPVLLNALLYCTALFTPLTFSFDADYSFQRGPLGGTVFYVCIAYLVMTLFTIHVRFRDHRIRDFFVIYVCALGCLGAMAVDYLLDGVALLSAILVSSLVFYLFLRAQDMDHDPLTRLWNRRVYYEDCKKLGNAVTSVASVDMNGLKKTNDELGHDAGDRALRMIARGLHSITSRKVIAYRVGGDEFMILFLHSGEEEIRQAVGVFMEEIWRVGQSVAVGLAFRQESGDSLEEMIRVSDQRMYEDKGQYYRAHDRRRRQRS